MLKKVLYFVTGAAIGASVTYYILDKKYREETDTAIESMKRYYNSKLDDLVKKHGGEDPVKEDESSDKSFKTALKPDIMSVKKQEDIVNYSGYSKKEENTSVVKDEVIIETDEEELSDEDEYLDHIGSEFEPYKKEPYSISPEEFASGGDGSYDAVTYIYYAEDDVLATEFDVNINDDIMMTVGPNFRLYFGEYRDDTAYIRNDRMHTDYEIIRENMSYHKNVLGEE